MLEKPTVNPDDKLGPRSRADIEHYLRSNINNDIKEILNDSLMAAIDYEIFLAEIHISQIVAGIKRELTIETLRLKTLEDESSRMEKVLASDQELDAQQRAQLEQQLQLLKGQINELNDQLSDLNNQLQVINDDIDAIKARIDSKKEQRTRLVDQLERRVDQEIQSMHDNKDQLRQDILDRIDFDDIPPEQHDAVRAQVDKLVNLPLDKLNAEHKPRPISQLEKEVADSLKTSTGIKPNTMSDSLDNDDVLTAKLAQHKALCTRELLADSMSLSQSNDSLEDLQSTLERVVDAYVEQVSEKVYKCDDIVANIKSIRDLDNDLMEENQRLLEKQTELRDVKEHVSDVKQKINHLSEQTAKQEQKMSQTHTHTNMSHR